MIGKTYSVVRNSHPDAGVWCDKIECSGLTWEAAKAKAAELTAAENKAFPGRSSWSGDIFWIQMEGTPVRRAEGITK